MGRDYRKGKDKVMTIKEIQQEILRMKKEQDVCILAHAYQGQEILELQIIWEIPTDSAYRHPRVTATA